MTVTGEEFRTAVLEALTAESATWEGGVPDLVTPLTDGGLELSSLEVVRALVRIEDEFGMEFDDEVLWATEPRTVGDFLQMTTGAMPHTSR